MANASDAGSPAPARPSDGGGQGVGPEKLPIAGIGASAGGIQTLKTLFEALPERTGIAYVVIVHLAPESHSELPKILATRTRMPVLQVNEPVPLAADHVYVIPPDRQLRIADGDIAAHAFDERHGKRSPIDLFFRSLAAQHGDGFAVILTGAGSDGAVGLKAIKEAGGIVIVQDPNEAEYPSMPQSAIATGLADFILPVAAIARQLVDLAKAKAHVTYDLLERSEPEMLRRILALVRAKTGHDFSEYKKSTVLRRIVRRAQVTKREHLADYFKYLRENVEEVQALFGDLLISVTTFFRDAAAFEALASEVVPLLFVGKESGDAVRVWVAGCATGEEAYSMAILLLEEAANHENRPDLQVFASDLDSGALAVAREGRYPIAIEADVREDRLRRFFSREGDHYRAKRELRETVLFASHSLLKDPPFGRLDLISCRNLLIYLDRELQGQVCAIFHYALNPAGFLFLGLSESADSPPGLFRNVNREARIYQSVGRVIDRPLSLPRLLGPSRRHGPAMPARAALAVTSAGDASLHRQALELSAPPSILIDELHRAVHLSETAGRYLQPPAGPMTSDVTELVRRELRFDLRAALNRAFDRGEASLSLPIMVQFNGTPQRVYLQVRPVSGTPAQPVRHALVFFIEGGLADPAAAAAGGEGAQAEPKIRQLQEELQLTQVLLKSTREEAETTTEELRAANEELQSINEEYRSTSEELETSKEELQSINEELQTVNAELKIKLETVSRAHNDLQNLMAATDVGVLFLDQRLRIKRFTPHITELFNISTIDEGRPIGDFTHRLAYDHLLEDANQVLKELGSIEREIASRSRRWFLMRLRPYRTVDDRIDGVVVTFVDVTDRRAAEEALRQSEERLRQMTHLVEMSGESICVWDLDDGVLEWNRGSTALFGYSREEVLGKDKRVLLATEVPGSSFDAVVAQLQVAGNWTGEVRQRNKQGRHLIVDTLIDLVPVGGRRLVLETSRDVTERRSWEQRQNLLLDELTHRVRNTLTVVQSIAAETLRSTASSADFVERFEGRLAALARAHKLLVEAQWRGAELAALVRQQLVPYSPDGSDRLATDGDTILLPANLATPFGLVLHELATNAVKHGAWSVPGGRVTLRWRLDGGDGDRALWVEWTERGGPPVVEPTRSGFGARLIRTGLPHAAVELAFPPGGIVCTLSIPLTQPGSGDVPT